ncbi:MAG: hypothetical protein PVI41_10605, partial [Roseobacter sp.]
MLLKMLCRKSMFGHAPRRVKRAGNLQRFWCCESGVVTVDFVVGAAFIAIIGVNALGQTRDGAISMVQASASLLEGPPPILASEYTQATSTEGDAQASSSGGTYSSYSDRSESSDDTGTGSSEETSPDSGASGDTQSETAEETQTADSETDATSSPSQEESDT